MHECPICGQQCDCDGEDHGQQAPDDCRCALADANAEMEEEEEVFADDAGYALPEEFDDDDGEHDFTEEDLVT